MQKIAAVSLKVLLLVCALFSVSFFTKVAIKEHTLHRVTDVLDELKDNPQTNSRRQKRELILKAIDDIESAPKTVVSLPRSYALKAKLYHLLSKVEVWPDKRNQYLKNAIYNNHNAININHYDVQYWLFDLQVQNEINAGQPEFFWSLANALTLNKWNHEALSFMSFYCVLQWQKLPSNLKPLCSNTFKNVWEDEVRKQKLTTQLRGIYRFEDVIQEMIQ